MKKLFLSLFGLGVILLLIANHRIPFFRQHGGPWSIGFGISENFPHDPGVRDNPIYTLEQLKKENDSTRFLADPFFVKEKGVFYLFFEHQKTKPNATIGVMTSTDGKNYVYSKNVLEQPFHLSYPQVFKYRGNFYMIPETKGANAVLLYKAHDFPFDWRICDTLVDRVKLKDPSVFLSDTLNIMLASDDNLNMYLYEADSLFGKWKRHNRPVALTGSEARAGGRIFAHQNKLIVPVQNSRNGYGFGLSLYELDFKKGEYTMKRTKPFFLKQQPDIKEFNAGMHHFDLQRIDNKYYYIYDGNRLASKDEKWNIKGSLKMNCLDLKNWIAQRF